MDAVNVDRVNHQCFAACIAANLHLVLYKSPGEAQSTRSCKIFCRIFKGILKHGLSSIQFQQRTWRIITTSSNGPWVSSARPALTILAYPCQT